MSAIFQWRTCASLRDIVCIFAAIWKVISNVSDCSLNCKIKLDLYLSIYFLLQLYIRLCFHAFLYDLPPLSVYCKPLSLICCMYVASLVLWFARGRILTSTTTTPQSNNCALYFSTFLIFSFAKRIFYPFSLLTKSVHFYIVSLTLFVHWWSSSTYIIYYNYNVCVHVIDCAVLLYFLARRKKASERFCVVALICRFI